MYNNIILNWNSVIKEEDRVYHLSDLFFENKYCTKDFEVEFLNTLNGKKIFLKVIMNISNLFDYLKYRVKILHLFIHII